MINIDIYLFLVKLVRILMLLLRYCYFYAITIVSIRKVVIQVHGFVHLRKVTGWLKYAKKSCMR